MWERRRTFWAKTQRSHAPSAHRRTSTTYARISRRTIGSMVHTCLHRFTLARWVRSKRLIAVPPKNVQPDTKSPCVASGWLLAFQCGGNSPRIHFIWMPSLSRDHTYWGIYTQSCHKVHGACHMTTHSHTEIHVWTCRVISGAGLSSLHPAPVWSILHNPIACFCINSCHQDLKLYPRSLHFTTAKMFGVIMSPRSLCIHQRDRAHHHFIERLSLWARGVSALQRLTTTFCRVCLAVIH